MALRPTVQFQNPIIPGFAPDPSCIRVDDTYYLVNSSFHVFPGLPVYASKDLQSWTHICASLPGAQAVCRFRLT